MAVWLFLFLVFKHDSVSLYEVLVLTKSCESAGHSVSYGQGLQCYADCWTLHYIASRWQMNE